VALERLVLPSVPSAVLARPVVGLLVAVPSLDLAHLGVAANRHRLVVVRLDRQERSLRLHRLEVGVPSALRLHFPSSGRLQILGFSWVFSIQTVATQGVSDRFKATPQGRKPRASNVSETKALHGCVTIFRFRLQSRPSESSA
jgi:hypothetical protein